MTATPLRSGIELSELSPGIRPQDDLFRHVNGAWLERTEIPEDKARWGSFHLIAEQAEKDVRAIIEEVVDAEPGTEARKIGDLFTSFMDTERIEAMRRDFVANVSHELRTPLTALLGFIETLRGPARNDEAARDRFLDIMEREAGRMNRLIGDLLSLSRVEQDKRRRPVESVDLAALLRGTVAALSPAAEAVGVRLESRGIEGPTVVPGDNDQIVQVFHNLIENAVKYGGQGGVVRLSLVHIDHEPVLRGPGWAVTVEDQGEGIDALLGLTARLFVGAGDTVVTSAGGYPTFDFHVTGFGGELVRVPYRDDRQDAAALVARAAETSARMVYLCNPDNPMGGWHAPEVIAEIERTVRAAKPAEYDTGAQIPAGVAH